MAQKAASSLFCLLILSLPASARNLLIRGGTLIDGTGKAPSSTSHIPDFSGAGEPLWFAGRSQPALFQSPITSNTVP